MGAVGTVGAVGMVGAEPRADTDESRRAEAAVPEEFARSTGSRGLGRDGLCIEFALAKYSSASRTTFARR
jgi:hypothetical protein